MLTCTSAALVSLLFYFGSVSVAKAADHTVELQPVNLSQTLEISSARSPYPISHRGSGRIYDRVIS